MEKGGSEAERLLWTFIALKHEWHKCQSISPLLGKPIKKKMCYEITNFEMLEGSKLLNFLPCTDTSLFASFLLLWFLQAAFEWQVWHLMWTKVSSFLLPIFPWSAHTHGRLSEVWNATWLNEWYIYLLLYLETFVVCFTISQEMLIKASSSLPFPSSKDGF